MSSLLTSNGTLTNSEQGTRRARPRSPPRRGVGADALRVARGHRATGSVAGDARIVAPTASCSSSRGSPTSPLNQLLQVLNVSKQALNQPLRQLYTQELVTFTPAPNDRRQRRLVLTGAGRELEQQLTGLQYAMFDAALSAAGPRGEAAWRRVMRHMANAGEEAIGKGVAGSQNLVRRYSVASRGCCSRGSPSGRSSWPSSPKPASTT